ncbi:MAG: hypothetical protein ACKN85_10620 [Pirellula sp.]
MKLLKEENVTMDILRRQSGEGLENHWFERQLGQGFLRNFQ